MKSIKTIAWVLVFTFLMVNMSSCIVVSKHDNGLHKGFFKNGGGHGHGNGKHKGKH